VHTGEEDHWIDNIKTWTGLPVEESIRMTEDIDKWRNYVHGVANLRSRTAKGQNRTGLGLVRVTVNSRVRVRIRVSVVGLWLWLALEQVAW